jgi:nucleoside-diphosphate-sugar epimerase
VTAHRIAVLGATGYLGRPLSVALAADANVELVLALGRRPEPPDGLVPRTGIEYTACDALSGSIAEPLARHGIDVLVHLAFTSRPTRHRAAAFATNVVAAERALAAAAAAGVRRVVLVSSVGVYGTRPLSDPVTELAAPRPNAFQFSRDKALQELAVHSAAAAGGLSLAVARPCTVVAADGPNFVVELLSRRIVPLPRAHEAAWQFLHVDDFCTAVGTLALGAQEGPYNLAPPDAVPLRDAVRVLGGRPLPVPRAMLMAGAQLSWSLRADRAIPRSALEFLAHPPLVSAARARADLGFEPSYTSAAALADARRRRERVSLALSPAAGASP